MCPFPPLLSVGTELSSCHVLCWRCMELFVTCCDLQSYPDHRIAFVYTESRYDCGCAHLTHPDLFVDRSVDRSAVLFYAT